MKAIANQIINGELIDISDFTDEDLMYLAFELRSVVNDTKLENNKTEKLRRLENVTTFARIKMPNLTGLKFVNVIVRNQIDVSPRTIKSFNEYYEVFAPLLIQNKDFDKWYLPGHSPEEEDAADAKFEAEEVEE